MFTWWHCLSCGETTKLQKITGDAWIFDIITAVFSFRLIYFPSPFCGPSVGPELVLMPLAYSNFVLCSCLKRSNWPTVWTGAALMIIEAAPLTLERGSHFLKIADWQFSEIFKNSAFWDFLVFNTNFVDLTKIFKRATSYFYTLLGKICTINITLKTYV